MKKSFFYILPIIGLLTSCLGYSTYAKFTPLSNEVKCEAKPTEVELYFEGETINFEYEKVGLIEAKGGYTDNEKEIIPALKKEAANKCCNAIIGLKKGYLTEEMGILFTTEKPEKYQAIVYNGIAVIKK